jgi:cytoskeletal protein RodZ
MDYRYRDQAKDGVNVIVWLIVATVVIGGLALLWVYVFNPLLINKNAQNLQQSYGAQTANIDAARNAITASQVTTSVGAKRALVIQACNEISNVQVQNRTPDITAFYSQNCP